MGSTSFYMTLPSNGSMDLFPNNTLANFKIQIPTRLYLGQNYEVALVEIQYPLRWETFSDANSYAMKLRIRNANGIGFKTETVRIEGGYYKSVEELLKIMNKTLSGYLQANDHDRDAIVLRENKYKHRLHVACHDGFSIEFAPEFCYALGFEPDRIYSNPSNWSSREYDLAHGFYSLYVYCNIVEPQIVGDVYAPLLRTVAVKGNFGEHVIKTYGEPHYLKVNADEVRVIEINIKDDTGRTVPFMSGRVVCKLHFRQRTI